MRFPAIETSLLAITLAWGLSFVVLGEAESAAGAWGLTALRMTVGAVAMTLLLRPRFRQMERPVVLGALAGGVLLAGGYVLQTAGMAPDGEATTAPGAGGFLTAFYIPLVPLLESIVKRRLPPWTDILVLLVATAGIYLIAFPDGDFTMNRGAQLVALSAFFWAGQIVVVDRIASRADPAALSTLQIAVCAIVGWIGRASSDEHAVVWSGTLAWQVFFLGYVTCGLAFAVQAWAQKTYSPTRIAIFFSLEPVFASLGGLWISDEDFPVRKLAGSACVLAAVVATLWLHRQQQQAARGDTLPA